jgi:F-type H+-transporting ATPase subunit a
MADPVLHIKDSYYFEVPKVLAPSTFARVEDFPDVWVSLDEEYQEWHFDRLFDRITQIKDRKGFSVVNLSLGIRGGKIAVHDRWKHWQHESHENHGKPFDEFLESVYAHHLAESAKLKATTIADWEKAKSSAKATGQPFDENMFQQAREMVLSNYLHHSQPDFMQFSEWRDDPQNAQQWKQIRREANNVQLFKEQVEKGEIKVQWDQKKIDAYNYHLSGKILIPQPFATLRNLYEAHPANHWYELGISKFMIIEVAVALIMIGVFSWLARRVAKGGPPKGKLWNLLETFLVFIRDQIAEPAIGHHDAHKFLPYLWTVFFFVLGCNLFGMVPWAGSPTGTFGVTLGLAALTFAFGMVGGMGRFGFTGYFKNIVPHMDLPLVLAIFIKPMLFLIELLGLLIKHGVLAVRLLANMVAGHLVLLGVLGVAFTAEAVAQFDGNYGMWSVAAVISILSCVAFSMLELFVAFLQAYVFTFLSALFIGASLHEH